MGINAGAVTIVPGTTAYDLGLVKPVAPTIGVLAVQGDVREHARELAVLAFEAAGCEGLARVDFFWTDDGDLLVNEINTMPGFTPLSMFPMCWAASGMTYAELVEELLQLALARPTGLR